MNELQNKLYNGLIEIDRICKKNKIKYFLAGGSALGVVRHKGFIPWDDDIDITMPRKDYSKFLKICKSDLGAEFDLQCIEYDGYYILPFAKVSINNTTYIRKNCQHYKMHHRVSIDVFPLDGVSENPILRIVQNALRYTNRAIARFRRYTLGGKNRMLWRSIELIFSNKFWSKVFCAVSWLMGNIVDSSKCKIWICSYGKYSVDKETCPASYWGEPVFLPFETGFFPVPEKYREYLTHLYGEYMVLPPLEEQRPPHPAIVDVSIDYKNFFNRVEVSEKRNN